MDVRSFQNTDPPQLANIWNSQPPTLGMAVGLSPAHFEAHLFAKPYFDARRMLIAETDGKITAFLHWGFALGAETCEIDKRLAVIGMALADPTRPDGQKQLAELIGQAESDAKAEGAEMILGMEAWPVAPFYHGLYGGSLPGGIMQKDALRHDLFSSLGYVNLKPYQHLKLDVRTFRPPVNRVQMNIRRQSQLQPLKPNDTWQCVCRFGELPRFGVEFTDKKSKEISVKVRFWEMSPMDQSRNVRLLGLESMQATEAATPDHIAFAMGDGLMHARRLGYEEFWLTVDSEVDKLSQAARLLGCEPLETSTAVAKPLADDLKEVELRARFENLVSEDTTTVM